jgi:hypothetical protein
MDNEITIFEKEMMAIAKTEEIDLIELSALLS